MGPKTAPAKLRAVSTLSDKNKGYKRGRAMAFLDTVAMNYTTVDGAGGVLFDGAGGRENGAKELFLMELEACLKLAGPGLRSEQHTRRECLRMKDKLHMSDANYSEMRGMLAGVAKCTTTVYGIRKERTTMNDAAKKYFGVELMSESGGYMVQRLDRVLLVSTLLSVLEGNDWERDPEEAMVFKLTVDGTLFVGRQCVNAAVVPVSHYIGRGVHSTSNVMPFYIGFCGESKELFTELAPTIKRAVLQLDGRKLHAKLPGLVDLHVGGDLKSMMILSGKGDWSCIYCGCPSAEVKGSYGGKYALTRAGEGTLWGLTMDKLHFCSLHAAMRVTECLIKRLAVLVWRCKADETTANVAAANRPSSAAAKPDYAAVAKEHVAFALDLAAALKKVGGSFICRMESKAALKKQREAAAAMQQAKAARRAGGEVDLAATLVICAPDNTPAEVRTDEEVQDAAEHGHKDYLLQMSSLSGANLLHFWGWKVFKTKHPRTKKVTSQKWMQVAAPPYKGLLEKWLPARTYPEENKRVLRLFDHFAVWIIPVLMFSQGEKFPAYARDWFECGDGMGEAEWRVAMEGRGLKLGRLYTSMFGDTCTPYIHIISHHMFDIIHGTGSLGSIVIWNQQGLEARHRKIGQNVTRNCSIKGDYSAVSLQLLLKEMREILCALSVLFEKEKDALTEEEKSTVWYDLIQSVLLEAKLPETKY